LYAFNAYVQQLKELVYVKQKVISKGDQKMFETRRMSKRKRRRIKRTRPTVSKSTAQRIHAKRKFLLRVGVELTSELRRDLVNKILSKEAGLVSKQSNRVSIYDVKHVAEGKEKVFRLVFDKMRKNIVTILNNLERPENVEHKLGLKNASELNSEENLHKSEEKKIGRNNI